MGYSRPTPLEAPDVWDFIQIVHKLLYNPHIRKLAAIGKWRVMEIKFFIRGFEPTQIMFDSVHELIASIASDFSLSLDSIEKIFISDKQQYGEVLRMIDPIASYTNQGQVVGVGKTISRISEERTIAHTLAFQDFVIDKALAGWKSGKHYDSFLLDQQQCFYVIVHEIGHCLDNEKRKDLYTPPLLGNTGCFRIKEIGDYYYSILKSEFSACALTAKYMTSELLQTEIDNFIANVSDTLFQINLSKESYKNSGQGSELRDLAYQVVGGSWFILIQYSKIIGYSVENQTTIENIFSEMRTKLTLDGLDIIGHFEQGLRQTWHFYPIWIPEFHKFCFDCWRSLCLKNGYRFEEGPDGDSIYF